MMTKTLLLGALGMISVVNVAFATPTTQELAAMFKADKGDPVMVYSVEKALKGIYIEKYRYDYSVETMYCNGKRFNQLTDEVTKYMRQSLEPMAIAAARMAASYAATCASVDIDRRGTTEYAYYAHQVGLAYGMMLQIEKVKTATPIYNDALGYLSYASANGMSKEVGWMIDALRKQVPSSPKSRK